MISFQSTNPKYQSRTWYEAGKYLFTAFFASAVFFSAFSFANADITTGLVGHWKFDEGSGVTAGDSAGSNNGTLIGGPTWTTGKVGGAVSFDGSDDYVKTITSSSIDSAIDGANITVALWFKTDLLSQDNQNLLSFIADDNNYQYVRYRNSGALRSFQSIGGTGSGITSSVYITDTNWHQLIWIIEGTSNKIYLDGLFKETITLANSIAGMVGSAEVYIGSKPTSNYYFNGLIDDVRVYNRALTQTDITELYNFTGGTTPIPPLPPPPPPPPPPPSSGSIPWASSNSPLVLNLHPRLFFIPQSYRNANPNAVGITVQEMRNKLNTYYRAEFQAFINVTDNHFNDTVSSKPMLFMTNDAVNLAFLYMMDPGVMSNPPYNFTFANSKNGYGSKAIEHALQAAQNAKANTNFDKGNWNDYSIFRDGSDMDGPLSLSLGIVADWLNPLLSKSEKQKIADGLINLYNIRDIIYPLTTSKYFGVAQNGDAGVLGLYGDDIDTSGSYYKDNIQRIINSVETDWLIGVVDFMNYFFNNSAGYQLSPLYNKLAYPKAFVMMNALSSTLNTDYFDKLKYFKEHPLLLLYNIEPLPDSDGTYHLQDWGDNEPNMPIKHLEQYLGSIGPLEKSNPNYAKLTKWIKNDSGFFDLPGVFKEVSSSSEREHYLWFYFFAGDKHVESKSPYDLNLPLSKRLGYGEVVMRSGFNSADDSLITFWTPEYFIRGGHNHIGEISSFLIQKHGRLAMQRSIDKKFKGGNIGISKRSFTHNSIVVFKPGDSDSYNDGYNKGFFRDDTNFDQLVMDPSNPVYSTTGKNHIGSLKSIDLNGVDFDYINYDYSDSWIKSKVDYAQREFIYLRSQNGADDEYIVVFDRINAVDSSFTKYWLLQSSLNPDILSNNMIKIVNNYSAVNAHGALYNKVLLPTSFQINKVGGPGHYWEDLEGQLIWDGFLSDQEKYDRGTYTLQVQSKTNQKYDNFLNVMQFGDSNTLSSMNSTTRIDADTMTGALINDPNTPRIVMFSKDQRGAQVSTVTYNANYSSSKIGKHLLVDIQPGTYEVYKNGTKIYSNKQASSQGVLTFSSTGGSTFQIVQTGSAPPPPPPPLTGDLNQDGTVNTLDWSIMNSAWGSSNTQADLNNDGIVNTIDFSIMNKNWS